MSDRPTDRAIEYFTEAGQRAGEAGRNFSTLSMQGGQLRQADDHQRAEMALARSVETIAWGLRHLSIGLRATYILLDEVNRKLPK
jgi:hypothetical protein